MTPDEKALSTFGVDLHQALPSALELLTLGGH
jgi:hypothetical protein